MALDAPAIGKIQIKTEISGKFADSGKDQIRSPANPQKTQNNLLGYENKETFAEITTAYKDYTRPKADLIS